MLLVFFGENFIGGFFSPKKGLSSKFVVFGMGDVRLGGVIGLATGWPN
ncbi:MAG: hypothetical protein CM1200mP6_00520 [Anaerolineaceae bacterium]|nr:MAG: hypothetical protein CM1200mP6_00520 [Anaerolineaceae bacterium]